MPSSHLQFLFVLVPLLGLFASSSPAALGLAGTGSAAPPIIADKLGNRLMVLDGPWQFHLGDNPS